MELITLRTFDSSIDAHMLKVKLESEGIISFIFDEHMVSLNPLNNMLLGGIKLKIAQADFNKAMEIVEELDNYKFTDEKDELIRCPDCDSTDLYNGFKSMKGIRGVLSLIVSLILVVYPIYHKVVYRCKSCGCEFKRGENM